MINCKLSDLVARCRERGYTLDEVKDCIIKQENNNIVVDETHSSYPKKFKEGFTTNGVGTQLKKLLSYIGIKASPDCLCNKRAEYMDFQGVEWCEKNITIIVMWLQEEALKRKLPFTQRIGKIIVRKAISNAKKYS